MGNLEGWGGPVSMDMMKQQAELQRKILKRMKELGIEPVLQGFYGMVPHDLKNKINEAKVIEQGKWAGGFQRPGILDPTTKLFSKIADTYYAEMKICMEKIFIISEGSHFMKEENQWSGSEKCCGKYSVLHAEKLP
jgi:hypothetical protein